MPRMKSPARSAALAFTLATALALGIALAVETWGGMVPCALCLWERWPYRVGALVGLAAVLAPARALRPLLGVGLLTALAAAGLAGLHVGVEQGWWPSPSPECAAPVLRGATIAERLSRLPALPAKPCDDPTFLVPWLPLSFAAMNLLYALALASLLAISMRHSRARPR